MSQAGSRKCDVLVVDDDPSIRDLLRVMLEMNGYSVQLAPNGREAMQLLSYIDLPSLILLDMMMPVMNGWQFYSATRADPKLQNIPVVIITAYSKEEIEMPPVEILNKPFDFDVFWELVGKYCTKTVRRFA